jgi:hypothetical protein
MATSCDQFGRRVARLETHAVKALTFDDVPALVGLWKHGLFNTQRMLLEAVKRRAFGCIDAMLDAGSVSVNAFSRIVFWAPMQNAMLLSLARNDVQMAQWLRVRHKASWHDPSKGPLTSEQSNSVLYSMIDRVCSKSVHFLLECKINPNHVASNGVSPLSLAAHERRSVVPLVLLLSAKADPNIQPHKTLCCSRVVYGAVRALIRAKINVNTTNAAGDTALHMTLSDRRFCTSRALYNKLRQLLEAKAEPYTRNHAGLLPVQLLQTTDALSFQCKVKQLLEGD